jgi:hypothetical protein
MQNNLELVIKILKQHNEDDPKKTSYKRYLSNETPNLDDVRAGFARVTHRGKVKWIIRHKWPNKIRQYVKLNCLGIAMAFPISRRLNYESIGRSLFTIQPLESNENNQTTE